MNHLSALIRQASGKLFLLPALFLSSPLFAAGPPKPSSLSNPLAVTLLVIIGALLLIIVCLAYVLAGAAQVYVQRAKERNTAARTLLLVLCMLAAPSLFAQEAGPAAANGVSGLASTTFFMLMSVITVELVVIFSMLYLLRWLLAKETVRVALAEMPQESKEPRWKKLWDRMNNFRSEREEADLMLDHNYDNIRELDNRLPPWWLYGFYLCIIFAGIYLWRYHVAQSAPLSIEEYTLSMQKAAEQKEAFLAKAANKVDESNVKMLDDAGIASGKTLFGTNCAPCHGPEGSGVVGPNLTDAYWLHGGSLKDIFKTIKYGVQEKGMKPWKDDFSPVQLAQLASFVKSLQGKKVANPKDPQGELYNENAAPDSATTSPVIH